MPVTTQQDKVNVLPLSRNPNKAETETMLAPANALRILRRATGGTISKSTFYRWLSYGKLYSVRLGYRIFIPFPALEDLIRQCKAGERF